MSQTNRNRVIAIALLVAFSSLIVLRTCRRESDPVPPKPKEKSDEPSVSVPDFNIDTAMHFLTKQVNFGPRVPNSQAHKKTGDWLVRTLKGYGARVIEQEAQVQAWDGTPIRLRNIIAEINPEARRRVALAAHWDTRPYADKDPDESQRRKPIDGANDGASGVAVLLEIARLMQEQPVSFGVDILLFDAEDYGRPEWDKNETDRDYLTWCLGSQHWEKNPHRPGYHAMFGILLDMVGGKNARFNKEGISMQVAPDVVNKVWKIAEKLGYGELFQQPVTGEIIDDHIFMNRAGIRTIDIIDMRPSTRTMGFGGYEFGHTHHTHSDNLDNIDPDVLRAVGHTLTHFLYHTK